MVMGGAQMLKNNNNKGWGADVKTKNYNMQRTCVNSKVA